MMEKEREREKKNKNKRGKTCSKDKVHVIERGTLRMREDQ